jgi:hypothetical protein
MDSIQGEARGVDHRLDVYFVSVQPLQAVTKRSQCLSDVSPCGNRAVRNSAINEARIDIFDRIQP